MATDLLIKLTLLQTAIFGIPFPSDMPEGAKNMTHTDMDDWTFRNYDGNIQYAWNENLPKISTILLEKGKVKLESIRYHPHALDLGPGQISTIRVYL